MALVIKKEEILKLIDDIDVVSAMEEGFIAYSNGQCVVPPVGELLFPEENGECHIKYGNIKGVSEFVIKIASGFYNNPEKGLSSSQGMMLVFNQKTGQSEAILLDDGHLTNIRTAAAGALVAKYFAPKKVDAIGIIGAGIQGRLQLKHLKPFIDCKTVYVWDINKEQTASFIKKFEQYYDVHICVTPTDVADACRYIVTTTPATTPLLTAKDIRSGTHITAVGSDTPEKQELDSQIIAKADIVISDSLPQSKTRGEIFQARKDQLITDQGITELGNSIQDLSLQRLNDQQITVADLTGVAVQDIMIARAVFNNFKIK